MGRTLVQSLDSVKDLSINDRLKIQEIRSRYNYSILADLLVIFHFIFVLFVVFGGLFVFKWPKVGYIHIPAAVWGVLVEIKGWVCPLTPIENRLRLVAGTETYQDSFVQHYLIPVIYPTSLTREIQLLLGLSVLILNVIVYIWVLLRVLRRKNHA